MINSAAFYGTEIYFKAGGGTVGADSITKLNISFVPAIGGIERDKRYLHQTSIGLSYIEAGLHRLVDFVIEFKVNRRS